MLGCWYRWNKILLVCRSEGGAEMLVMSNPRAVHDAYLRVLINAWGCTIAGRSKFRTLSKPAATLFGAKDRNLNSTNFKTLISWFMPIHLQALVITIVTEPVMTMSVVIVWVLNMAGDFGVSLVFAASVYSEPATTLTRVVLPSSISVNGLTAVLESPFWAYRSPNIWQVRKHHMAVFVEALACSNLMSCLNFMSGERRASKTATHHHCG